MRPYYFVERQSLNISIEEAWKFLSDPSNLKKITPPSMDFSIVGEPPKEMYEGLIIEYSVRPLPFMRSRWVSEITHLRPPYFFVDEQRIGPYAMWHHEHHLLEKDGGVEMVDRITYALKQPLIDGVVNSLIVRPKINGIFSYRRKILAEMCSKE